MNSFNGYLSIGEVSRTLAASLGRAETDVFQDVRRVFLELVAHRFCLPQ